MMPERRSGASLRKEMVDSLERMGAIRGRPVRRVFQTVPRELFVPEIATRDGLAAVYRHEVALATATDSRGTPISSSSATVIMALMLEDLDVHPGHRVLEIGAGTGYNAALLKGLVGPRGRVVSLDIETSFARRAQRALATAGYSCRVVVGDGREGWAPGAPYDRIIVTAASDRVPRAWRDQLVDGGLVQLPLRLTSAVVPQVVATFRREGTLLRSAAIVSGSFMVLRDADGADSPAEVDPTIRAMIRTKSNSKEFQFLSLDGQALSGLSTMASKRILTLLLGKSRRLRNLSTQSALGLVTFLQVSGIPTLVRCTVANRYGVALVGPRAAGVTAITRAFDQPGRIETWGDGEAEEALSRYVQRWERLGSPTLHELQLTVRFGPESGSTRPAWRELHTADSVVQMNWS
jgi:protein-L-isoaspartate(D-aspartate) O-methyltransferase